MAIKSPMVMHVALLTCKNCRSKTKSRSNSYEISRKKKVLEISGKKKVLEISRKKKVLKEFSSENNVRTSQNVKGVMI